MDVPENEQEIKAQHFKIALANISYDTTLLLFNRKNILELRYTAAHKWWDIQPLRI